jgi:hypothetical protein
MSRCNPTLRWGAGTTREKVADTAATREMEQRLAAMRRDRDAIDKMIAPSPEVKQSPTCQVVSFQETSPSHGVEQIIKEETTKEENKKWITFRSSN